MLNTQTKSNLFKKILLHSAKRSTIYFLIGVLFVFVSFLNGMLSLHDWDNYFALANKFGNIIIVLALISFFYNTMNFVCLSFERKLTEHRKVASLIFANLRKSLKIVFILAAINIAISLVDPSKFYLTLANNILHTLIIASIGWIIIQAFYTTEAIFYEYMLTLNEQEHMRIKALYTKMHILRNIATVVIVIITIAAILMSFNSVKNIGISLLASAGFLTAIVGLSAQKTLFSIFSGLQIALSQTIKIGDIVAIENQTGIIEEITFTYVTLKLGDQRRLIIPINYFIDKPFENWSQDNSIRSSFSFVVHSLLPVCELRLTLENILKESSNWDGVAGNLVVDDLMENGVKIRIQISAEDSDKLSSLRSDVKEKILEFIRTKYPEYALQG